jgi:hypothetical protein
VGQFGTPLMADFQLIAIGILALSQKFFTICATSLMGQTRWDSLGQNANA